MGPHVSPRDSDIKHFNQLEADGSAEASPKPKMWKSLSVWHHSPEKTLFTGYVWGREWDRGLVEYGRRILQ